MEKVNLKDFLDRAETVLSVSNTGSDFWIPGISIDTRTLRPRELFVAIRGDRFDGHQFVDAALRMGAGGAVVDENAISRFEDAEYPLIVVKDTVLFLQELAAWYRQRFELTVIGLTGSSGKTTTKEMLAAILQKRYTVLKTLGNLNNQIGVPLTLLRIDPQVEVAIIEMGTNHPGEIATLSRIAMPDIGMITNIGSGHIGFFGTKQSIYREKAALFDNIKNSGSIFLNTEDPLLSQYETNRGNVVTVGPTRDSDFQIKVMDIDDAGCVSFTVNDNDQFRVGIPGRHQLMNAALSIAVAMSLNVPVNDIRDALGSLRPGDKRMDVFQQNDVWFINDTYNASPESVIAAVDFLSEFRLKEKARRFLVMGDMLELGERSEEIHHNVGKYIQEKPIDFVFCYGTFCKGIYNLVSSRNGGQRVAEYFDTHEAIANRLNDILKPGDLVLLKGARGMAMENVLIKMGIRR